MAWEERVELVSANTGADLSATSNLYKAVKLNSTGDVVAVAAITDVPFGILYDTAASNRVVPVAVGGLSKAVAGATIAAGAPVAVKADGTLQTAATTQTVIGVARVAAVNGDVFTVNLQPAPIKA